MLHCIYFGVLQNGNPFGGVCQQCEWEAVKEVFISAEGLGSVLSDLSSTYLQQWSECLILSMHCRARGMLVYEVLQIEMYGAILSRCVGFCHCTSSEPVERNKFSTMLWDLCPLVVADVPCPCGKAAVTLEFSLLPVWRGIAVSLGSILHAALHAASFLLTFFPHFKPYVMSLASCGP